jgi:hypothetical protein
MPRVRFAGKIFPEVVKLTVADHPQINWHDAENNLDLIFTIIIQEGRITVECETNRFEARLITPIFMRAFDLARATVDLTAFSTGYGLVVIFDTFTSPSGEVTPFASYDPALPQLCTAFQMGVTAASIGENDFHRVLTIVSTDWRVFRALRYLIEAITVPHESSVNCARAIEALRHIIAPNQPRGEAWQTFRSTLNISREYLTMITDVSTGPRHGDPTHIQGTITTEITRRAWVIMNRFFEYKKRNDQQLPLDIFPLLSA